MQLRVMAGAGYITTAPDGFGLPAAKRANDEIETVAQIRAAENRVGVIKCRGKRE